MAEASCPCEEEEEGEVTPGGLIISTVLLALAMVTSKTHILQSLTGGIALPPPALALSARLDADATVCIVLCLAAYIICGRSVVLGAVRGILHGHVFDEQFLMTVASLGAVALGEAPEAVAVMLLYQVGEYFEDKAEDRSRRSIEALLSIRADTACVKRGGEETVVPADEVAVGETIVVRPGGRVPIDAVVTAGRSFLDTAALTGESVPVRVLEGSEIMAGSINSNAEGAGGEVIEAVTTRVAGQSAAARIVALVSESAERKAHSEKFITVFSRVYTPIVCALALLVAAVPSIVTGDAHTWVYRALIFLVVSCPCALVISVPLSFVAGLGRASRLGVLIKGAEFIEVLSRTRVAVFDKTGTLTRGSFAVTAVHPADGVDADELVAMAAHAETYSNHPVSRSIRAAHSCPLCNLVHIEQATEIPGQGISTVIDGKQVLAGNDALMKRYDVAGFAPCTMSDIGTVVHVAVGGHYAGHIVISDETKADAAAAVEHLRQAGVKRVVMLTGDSAEAAQSVAREVGVDEVRSRLLPQDKVTEVQRLLDELKSPCTNSNHSNDNSRGTLLFAGDGINDAPVLTLADAGIAMGALGSDAAVEAADVVVMTDEMEKVADAVRVSKATMRIVRQNIVFAIGVKVLIMVLGALGMANMWLAVFGDTGVALLATANALRASRAK